MCKTKEPRCAGALLIAQTVESFDLLLGLVVQELRWPGAVLQCSLCRDEPILLGLGVRTALEFFFARSDVSLVVAY